jgi:dual specificity phosphatase 12
MNWVIPQKLAVGDMVAAAEGPELRKRNIRGIVTARGRLSRSPEYYKRYGINILHIPVADDERTNIGHYFSMVYHFIENHLSKNQGVLVNCAAGISRSTSLVTAYLMRKYKLTATNAIHKIKSVRPCMNPNSGFIRQLYSYERLLKSHKLL